jgi:hypothetical protein
MILNNQTCQRCGQSYHSCKHCEASADSEARARQDGYCSDQCMSVAAAEIEDAASWRCSVNTEVATT